MSLRQRSQIQEMPSRRCGGIEERTRAPASLVTITAYALDMSMFLNESELTERKAFIESFVKEIVVMPDNGRVIKVRVTFTNDAATRSR